MSADVPEMKEMEIETAGAGCSASRQLSADPAAAIKFLEIETDGAGGSGKAMEMGKETEMVVDMEVRKELQIEVRRWRRRCGSR